MVLLPEGAPADVVRLFGALEARGHAWKAGTVGTGAHSGDTHVCADIAGAQEVVTTALTLLLARERGNPSGYAEVSLADAAEPFAEPLRQGLTTPGGPLGGGLPGYNLYETKDGTEVWRRKDLKKVQTTRTSVDGQRLLCGFEDKSFELLNLRTGRSKPSMRGVKDVIESVYDDLVVIDRQGRDFKLANADNQQIVLNQDLAGIAEAADA